MRIVYRSISRALKEAITRAKERNRPIEVIELDPDEWTDLMLELCVHPYFPAPPATAQFMGVPIRRAPAITEEV